MVTFNILRKGLRIAGSVFVAPAVGGIFNTNFVFAQDGQILGLERGYYRSVDDYYFRLTPKGSFIDLTLGYFWNKDFRKFADATYAF